jgi:hypothetical protein
VLNINTALQNRSVCTAFTIGLLSCIFTLQEQQSVEDVLAAANALLNNLQSGEPMPSTPGVQASIDELQGLGYVCDESGCVLVLPGDRQREDSKCSAVCPARCRCCT